MQPPETDVCALIETLPTSEKRSYNSEIKESFEISGAKLMNKENFLKFFGREMYDIDRSYLISKFRISSKRSGVISYTKSVECDHPIYYYSLHIAENCEIIKTETLSYEDDHVIMFKIESEISKTLKDLTIVKQASSEYGNEPDALTDTMFTDVYRIDLRSEKFDTIYRKSSFEVLPIPTREK